MHKWEYTQLLVYLHSPYAESLEKMGAEGWEAFSVINRPNNDVLIFFKREVSND